MNLISTQQLSVSNWSDFVALMQGDAQCSECFCLNHRMSAGCPTGVAAREKMKSLTTAQRVHGLLAYEGQGCVGWISVDPISELPGHDCQSTGKNQEWAIHCVFIKSGYRGTGISKILIEAAIKHARVNGAKLISAFPIPESSRAKFPAHEAEFSGRFSTFSKFEFRPDGDAEEFYQRMELSALE